MFTQTQEALFNELRTLGYTGALNDMLLKFLEDATQRKGTINDLMFWFLRNMGYTGSLSDMMKQMGIKPAIIALLFPTPAQKGLYYDTRDTATTYQEPAGTTPAVAGSNLGLLLDKSKGLVLGAELIGSTWTPSAATIVQSGSSLVFTNASQATPVHYATNTGSLVSGRWYLATFTVSNYSSGAISFSVGITSQGQLCTANGTYTQYVLASVSGTIEIRARGSLTNLTASAISVCELPGNHASQTTATNRPVLSPLRAIRPFDANSVLPVTLPALTGAKAYINTPYGWYKQSVTGGGVYNVPLKDTTQLVIAENLTAAQEAAIAGVFGGAEIDPLTIVLS